jgi:D-sedoheptulose 7-phosphate isomerase
MKYSKFFLDEIVNVAKKIDLTKLEKLCVTLSQIRKKKGRVFFLGIGGSAGNASHAVNDFRKLCNLECYSATDNVSELTARINDEGWDSSFSNWLKTSNLNSKDAIFILSVGGGNIKKKISINLVEAVKFAKRKNSKILGIVGKKDGYTYNNADIAIHIPNSVANLVTPISESYQAIIWHCLVSHPILQQNKTKW